jgi:hypothetical protein
MKGAPCSPIRLDGHPGCENAALRGSQRDGRTTADLTSHVYVVKRRIYIVSYGHINGSGPATESSGPFFASFSPQP